MTMVSGLFLVGVITSLGRAPVHTCFFVQYSTFYLFLKSLMIPNCQKQIRVAHPVSEEVTHTLPIEMGQRKRGRNGIYSAYTSCLDPLAWTHLIVTVSSYQFYNQKSHKQ